MCHISNLTKFIWFFIRYLNFQLNQKFLNLVKINYNLFSANHAIKQGFEQKAKQIKSNDFGYLLKCNGVISKIDVYKMFLLVVYL